MILIQNISKKFLNKTVLEAIDFELHPNEIVGLIGPNGSGKTTLLNILMGLIKPNSGTIWYPEGKQINAAVSRKGFFGDMRVSENLKLYARLNNLALAEVDRVLALLAIDYQNKKFGDLSAGMKQRVSLAQAFMGDYKLILLDEPTNHLDIDSIFCLRSAIEARKKSGTSFLISSHVLTELEKLCDRVLFLRDGKIVNTYTLSEITKELISLEDVYLKIMVR